MRNNRIVLTPDRAVPIEYIVKAGETHYPGMVVQLDPTVALQGGRHTAKIYSRTADGDRPAGPWIVVTEDIKQGKTVADAYNAGDRAVGAIPLQGCEINLLFNNVAGTADDVAAGNTFMVKNGAGKVAVKTGTPQTEVAMALENLIDPVVDTLIWSVWS